MAFDGGQSSAEGDEPEEGQLASVTARAYGDVGRESTLPG